MAKIQFFNPEPTHRRLRLLALLAGRPMIELVRDAVREYVDSRAAALPPSNDEAPDGDT